MGKTNNIVNNNSTERIVILGGGESGVGAAVLAKQKGFDVFVSDKGRIIDHYKSVLNTNNILWEDEKHTAELILNASEVIVSPGIPNTIPIVKEIKAKGISVISEIEFAGRYNTIKTICITGSNGKTTTTLLINHMLQKAGLNTSVAGNIGDSFALQIAQNRDKKALDYYVLELSSFQLDNMFEFKADTAILLNVTPDHLDRYDDNMQNYTDAKLRIIQNQTQEDTLVYCFDDTIISKEIVKKKARAQLFPFSIKREVEHGAYIDSNNQIIININNQNPLSMTIQELALQGKHNIYNTMAAAVTGSLLGIRKDVIRESMSDFHNAEHRLEVVGNVHGIEFINDSKATNINSTWYALESMGDETILILGGVDKGNDYSIIEGLVRDKVKAIICLGEDNKKIISAFEKFADTIVEAKSAKEAVNHAYRLGKKGDTVLLSPACASFDLFDNYEDRGNQYKEAVKNL